MFERRKARPPQKRIDSLIGAGTVVQGNVMFAGGLRIDGNRASIDHERADGGRDFLLLRARRTDEHHRQQRGWTCNQATLDSDHEDTPAEMRKSGHGHSSRPMSDESCARATRASNRA